jgi:hypothetical protein
LTLPFSSLSHFVIPANAGTQSYSIDSAGADRFAQTVWVPASAGMTKNKGG